MPPKLPGRSDSFAYDCALIEMVKKHGFERDCKEDRADVRIQSTGTSTDSTACTFLGARSILR
jgi:hypothetical protein